MAIIILLLCFVSIFFNIAIRAKKGEKIIEQLIKSVLVFSVLIVFITEFTSIFYLLEFKIILLFWIGIFVISMLILLSKKEQLFLKISSIKQKIIKNFHSLNKFEKNIGLLFLIIIFLVFIQGIIYPPNNWDSMTYHLARIPHWISHKTVEHYPTHIYKQLYQPPFSGYVILHFNILNFGDYFSNTVQFLYMIFSLFAIVLIVELLGLKRPFKFIAIILLFAIPEVLLQASSTQNDIITSFFILTSTYFVVKSFNKTHIENYFFLGLSIGLGILTKGITYIYLAPILIIFSIAVLYKLYKTKDYTILLYSTIAVIISISISFGHYKRNYTLCDNILGTRDLDMNTFKNEDLSLILLFSNIIKNVELHSIPYPINIVSNKMIQELHSFIGVNVNETNLRNTKFEYPSKLPFHEDNAHNSIHFFNIYIIYIIRSQ